MGRERKKRERARGRGEIGRERRERERREQKELFKPTPGEVWFKQGFRSPKEHGAAYLCMYCSVLGSYHGVQVGAEHYVLPDDAVEFERRKPGDEHHRAGGGSCLHTCRGTRN